MLLRVFLRYRRAVILSIALLVSFLFMTVQVRQEGPLVDLVERGLVLTVTPFLKLYAAVTGTTSRLWANYVDLRRGRGGDPPPPGGGGSPPGRGGRPGA